MRHIDLSIDVEVETESAQLVYNAIIDYLYRMTMDADVASVVRSFELSESVL